MEMSLHQRHIQDFGYPLWIIPNFLWLAYQAKNVSLGHSCIPMDVYEYLDLYYFFSRYPFKIFKSNMTV